MPMSLMTHDQSPSVFLLFVYCHVCPQFVFFLLLINLGADQKKSGLWERDWLPFDSLHGGHIGVQEQ